MADDSYLAICKPGPGVYPLGYVPHNHHFLWFAATMEGAGEIARVAAVHRGAEFLEALRGPFHRPAQLARGVRDDDVFRVDARLHAETTAHVADANAHLLLGQAGQRVDADRQRALAALQLGEDLVAFRDTDGRIGLIDEQCPHRRASLFYGRNEECGLRCLYHGWKFDVEGNCVEMASEPAESSFCDKVNIKSYPVVESGGFIWTYMGPGETMPDPGRLHRLQDNRVGQHADLFDLDFRPGHACSFAKEDTAPQNNLASLIDIQDKPVTKVAHFIFLYLNVIKHPGTVSFSIDDQVVAAGFDTFDNKISTAVGVNAFEVLAILSDCYSGISDARAAIRSNLAF